MLMAATTEHISFDQSSLWSKFDIEQIGRWPCGPLKEKQTKSIYSSTMPYALQHHVASKAPFERRWRNPHWWLHQRQEVPSHLVGHRRREATRYLRVATNSATLRGRNAGRQFAGWCRISSINRINCFFYWMLPINTNSHLPRFPILKRMIKDCFPGAGSHHKYTSLCQGTLQQNGTNRRMVFPENERQAKSNITGDTLTDSNNMQQWQPLPCVCSPSQ